MAKDDPRIPNLQDTFTPIGVPLSGIYQKSFAHKVIKDKLPVILTKVINSLCQNKTQILETYGEKATEDIKAIVGFISQLKNEIVTNKTIKPMRLNPKADINDAEEWNKYLGHRTALEGEIPTWFNTIWLYCETYMYRVLAQEIGLTDTLHSYDPFEQQKQAEFINSYESMAVLASYVKNIVCNEEYNVANSPNDFLKLLKCCLWGNRYDLSATAGDPYSQTGDPLETVESLNEYILVNDWKFIWSLVNEKGNDNDNIHIVLDNAGYELFTDLCLAAFLVTIVPTTRIIFHLKLYPWYLSDATIHDFLWILDHMSNLTNYPDIQLLGKTFENLLDKEIWSIEEESYWTGPYDFTQMKEKDKELYTQFCNAKLVIFKGDLNYRKLLGDINFEYHNNFKNALGDFLPTNILCLRTMKSDICVGLPNHMTQFFQQNIDKMTTGMYGLIQAAACKKN
ncbi:hypothetical protein P5V15_014645 [Pogonomyrmex californicus]